MSAATDDARLIRHDALDVMSRGMSAMATHTERVARENQDLRIRVAELEELAVKPLTRLVPDETDQ